MLAWTANERRGPGGGAAAVRSASGPSSGRLVTPHNSDLPCHRKLTMAPVPPRTRAWRVTWLCTISSLELAIWLLLPERTCRSDSVIHSQKHGRARSEFKQVGPHERLSAEG